MFTSILSQYWTIYNTLMGTYVVNFMKNDTFNKLFLHWLITRLTFCFLVKLNCREFWSTCFKFSHTRVSHSEFSCILFLGWGSPNIEIEAVTYMRVTSPTGVLLRQCCGSTASSPSPSRLRCAGQPWRKVSRYRSRWSNNFQLKC